MKPPTPTTAPIMVFLVLVLRPPPLVLPLLVREALLVGEEEDVVDVVVGDVFWFVLGGGVVLLGELVEEVWSSLELEEGEEVGFGVELVGLSVVLVGVELVVVEVVGGPVVVEGGSVSVGLLVGEASVLLGLSEVVLSEGLSVDESTGAGKSSPCRPTMFGLDTIAWVTATAARQATSECARNSMMPVLMGLMRGRGRAQCWSVDTETAAGRIEGVC